MDCKKKGGKSSCQVVLFAFGIFVDCIGFVID